MAWMTDRAAGSPDAGTDRVFQGGNQLFRLVLVVKSEMPCLTFLPLHFGQATLVLPCSEMLRMTENFFLHSLHSYSYVGISILLCPSGDGFTRAPLPPAGKGRRLHTAGTFSVCFILVDRHILSRGE